MLVPEHRWAVADSIGTKVACDREDPSPLPSRCVPTLYSQWQGPSATPENDRLRTSCLFVITPKCPRPRELMPTKLPQAALPSRLIGYARVSTEEQDTRSAARRTARRLLRAAPCGD